MDNSGGFVEIYPNLNSENGTTSKGNVNGYDVTIVAEPSINQNEKKEKEKNQNEKNEKNACLRFLKTNLLTILTILGVVLGVGVGLILKTTRSQWTEREIMYVNFPGDLFLRLLKSLILPLIISSLISAIANLDLSLSGKIARRAILYYMATTLFAIILGIILAVTVRPGYILDERIETGNSGVRNVTIADTMLDLVRNMFPPNLVEACIAQYRTVLTPPNPPTTDINSWKIKGENAEGMNILGLVVFSAIMGVTLARLGEEGRFLAQFFQALMTAMMKITTMVIWLSPLGIFFLVCSKILEVDDFEAMVAQLGLYFVTVLGGILFHGLIVLSSLYFLITRKSPIGYVLNMAQAISTAFGTSSSSATLPVTIQCLEDRNNIDKRVSRFVLPIGATINMDGTALYEAVAAIFIAQYRGVSLTLGDYIAISLTATAASIGAAGIPQAGLVTMVMVLDAVGLPAEDVTLILAVDWLLDRFRTTINVLGDAFGAGIVNHLSRNELKELEEKNESGSENTSIIPEDEICTR